MKIHIVSHTHWDREWYRPFQYFKVKLSYFFDRLLNTLEDDHEYRHFMLDGQMVMVEDYLDLKPQNKHRIERLVKQGKLIIGPWYTQPDEFAPDGESLLRNLMMGINMATEYGDCMDIGYLPDSFGQSSQMPHILQGCNISSACLMRGVPVHRLTQSEFVWRGLNGDQVLTVALPRGYSNAMFLPKTDELIGVRVAREIMDLEKIGNKEYILLLNGVDHQMPQPQITKYIQSKKQSEDEYIHSTLAKYIQDVAQSTDTLARIDGELIDPVTNRVHTSVASSRMYQKTKNRRMQTLMENSVEPLCTMAWMLGTEYPQEIINSAWKEIFKNQSHDSICGCCTDEVHTEIDQRFTDVQNIGETLQKMHSRAIAAAVAGSDMAMVVFNDSMVMSKQMVRATVYSDSDYFALLDEQGNDIDYTIESTEKINAASMSIWSLYLDTPCIVNRVDISFELDFDFNCGYRRLSIVEEQKPQNDTGYREMSVCEMENKFSIISINRDGTFDLMDKESKRKYTNLNTIQDCADAGDTYNYSPAEHDRVITNTSVEQCNVEIMESVNKKVAILSYQMQIPEGLSTDDKCRVEDLVALDIESEITMYENIKRIDIKTKVVNRAKDHRIRVLFPTGIESDYSYAETQFGTIKRDNVIADAQNWRENKWAEKPLPIYSKQKFVDINNGEIGLAILNRGLTEYEIYDCDGATIATTLVRAVGYMGKADLAIRPGRPSGVPIATPDAQCLGESVLEYSILAHIGGVDEGQIAKHAAIYSAPPTTAQSEIKLTAIYDKHSATVNLFDIETLQGCAQDRLVDIGESSFSLVRIDGEGLIISALKMAENDQAIVLRVYNPTAKAIQSRHIHINAEMDKVYECDFVERNTGEINHNGQLFETNSIRGYSAQTYKIYIK